MAPPVRKPKKELTIEKLRGMIPTTASRSRRRQFVGKLRTLVQREKAAKRRSRKKQEERGEEVVRQTPNTIESLRVKDDTVVEDDAEIAEADEVDEFATYMSGERPPKLLLTTSPNPSKQLLAFIKELVLIVPSMYYYKRGTYRLQSIVKYATNKEFTDVLVLAEHRKKPCGLYICHLPEGPTSFFRLTNVKLAQEMYGSAALTTHSPEVILNNFTTRLGRRVARQLMALFPQKPEFRGRRAVCFHNQRDFIFFRHHRYIFCNGGGKCRLQEIGPRFTLKLRWLQQGVFDTRKGLMEYEWRPDSQVDRKKVYL